MKFFYISSIIILVSLISQAQVIEDVKLSSQAQTIVKKDGCAEAAIISVRDYIQNLNEQPGTKIPNGGFPIPYIKQALKYSQNQYGILVTNYSLPTLIVKTRISQKKCIAGKPIEPSFKIQ